MKKKTKSQQTAISVVLGKLLYIGFSAQIVFGIIWIVKNMGYIQLFGESANCVTLADRFMSDGNTGILYPAILLIARAFGKLTTARWYSVIYIFQLILAMMSGYHLIREAELFGGKKKRAVWGSLVIMTFPSIMQLHMAILTNSLVLSLLMLEAALTIRIWKTTHDERNDWQDFLYDLSGVMLFWLMLSLTKWIYVVLASLPVIASIILIIIRVRKMADGFSKKARAEIVKADMTPMIRSRALTSLKRRAGDYVVRTSCIAVLTAMIFLGLILGVDNLTVNKRFSTRQEFNIDRILFERMAWKSRFSRSGSWLLEIKDVVSDDILLETSRHQENVRLIMEPALVEAVGEDKANELIRFTNRAVWEHDRKELLHDIAIDGAGYIAPQIMGRLFLESDYVTYTPRNYDIFKRNTPLLAKYYTDYANIWFYIAVGIGVIMLLEGIILGRFGKRKNAVGAIVVLVAMCGVIAIRNIMLGSSVYDYKEAGSAAVAWFMAIFMICEKSMFDEDVR